MRIITAKYFAQHASEIGKYLNQNPLDYYFVTNKTDPRKNFICCKVALIEELIREKDPGNIVGRMALLDDRFKIERSLMSKRMSQAHWDNVKMGYGNKSKVENVRSIVSDNDPVASIVDHIPSLKNLAGVRGRRTRLVHKIYSEGRRSPKNQTVHSIV